MRVEPARWNTTAKSRAPARCRTSPTIARQQLALAEAERKYRSLFQEFRDGHVPEPSRWPFDAGQRCARPHPRLRERRLLKTGVAHMNQIYARPDDRARLIERLLEEGGVDDVIFNARRRDGSEVIVELSARTILDGDGNPRLYRRFRAGHHRAAVAETRVAAIRNALSHPRRTQSGWRLHDARRSLHVCEPCLRRDVRLFGKRTRRCEFSRARAAGIARSSGNALSAANAGEPIQPRRLLRDSGAQGRRRIEVDGQRGYASHRWPAYTTGTIRDVTDATARTAPAWNTTPVMTC